MLKNVTSYTSETRCGSCGTLLCRVRESGEVVVCVAAQCCSDPIAARTVLPTHPATVDPAAIGLNPRGPGEENVRFRLRNAPPDAAAALASLRSAVEGK